MFRNLKKNEKVLQIRTNNAMPEELEVIMQVGSRIIRVFYNQKEFKEEFLGNIPDEYVFKTYNLERRQ